MGRLFVTLTLAAAAGLIVQGSFAATGDIVAQFVPDGPTGNGRGITFDGENLYYTIEGDANIYKISTMGKLLATIPVAGAASRGGPLAWDGHYLWTIDYSVDSFAPLQIDPANGSIVFSCNIATANPLHPAVTSRFNVGNFPDGMAYANGELVISSEVLPTPNWVVFINPLTCLITNAFNPPVIDGYGGSGVAFDTQDLWHSNANGEQYQTDTAGALTGASFSNLIQLEDLEYDCITFAPTCVIWSNEASIGPNHITAYEIPCGPLPSAVASVSWGSIKTRHR